MTAPGLPNYANYEFVFSAPDGRSGVMPGIELHRMILAALNSSRAELIESIAAGFDTAAKDAAVHNKGPDRDIDVVLAWECAARWIREHAANRPTAVAAAVSSPTGTPGSPDPRDAVVAAAIAWRRMRDGGPTKPKPESAGLITAVDALPATSPTGDPTP